MHDCEDLIRIFNTCFEKQYNTHLVKGGDEPLYLPMHDTQPFHAIIFTKDYFMSALHECAHWFIAGESRRLLVDYGYWYEPDGRNMLQQAAFQQVEVKPQAIECVLAMAANHPFQISNDNLNGEPSEYQAFEKSVYQQVDCYLNVGLPLRAHMFREALLEFYGI